MLPTKHHGWTTYTDSVFGYLISHLPRELSPSSIEKYGLDWYIPLRQLHYLPLDALRHDVITCVDPGE